MKNIISLCGGRVLLFFLVRRKGFIAECPDSRSTAQGGAGSFCG